MPFEGGSRILAGDGDGLAIVGMAAYGVSAGNITGN
jgi:hypothetical protein